MIDNNEEDIEEWMVLLFICVTRAWFHFRTEFKGQLSMECWYCWASSQLHKQGYTFISPHDFELWQRAMVLYYWLLWLFFAILSCFLIFTILETFSFDVLQPFYQNVVLIVSFDTPSAILIHHDNAKWKQ